MNFPKLTNVFHPSDYTEASEVAFVHALKAALIDGACLTMFHVSQGALYADWTDFPGVRQTLERWGLLPGGSTRQDVAQLGIDVRKVIAQEENPVKAVLTYLQTHTTDLIVLATSQQNGRASWFPQSVSEPIARKSRQMTLFLPSGVKGFVSREDGSLALRNFLVPITHQPTPQLAVDAAGQMAQDLKLPEARFTLLHVGTERGNPEVKTYEESNWTWNQVTHAGEVVDTILQTATDCQADVIVMTTKGHEGFLDALRGNTTEQVVRRARCPLLAIPDE